MCIPIKLSVMGVTNNRCVTNSLSCVLLLVYKLSDAFLPGKTIYMDKWIFKIT
jgi:hypothetical protein